MFILHKIFCTPITFHNPLKDCFSNKKYLITIAISIFLIENPVLNGFLKIVSIQNQLTITFVQN